MWSSPFLLDEEGFKCTLDNEPATLTNYKFGDTVNIPLKDIEDFIIVTADSTLIGNYLQSEFENESQR